MSQSILYEDEARKALEKGIETLANAVAITMGPKGRNVVLAKQANVPEIINDGVTIAREIFLENSIENAGASLVKEAAAKTNEIAGDGTTTATVLAYHIIKNGLCYTAAGFNPLAIKQGILKSVKFVNDQILQIAKPITTSQDIIEIASISANNDKKIGNIIAKAFTKAGREGIISLEEGKSTQTELEITEGMQFDRGFMSPYFATSSITITKNDPFIFITDQTLTSVQKEIIPVLEIIAKTKKPLVIIAQDIEQKALSTLIMNQLKKRIDVVAIKAPGFGNEVSNFLHDISILTQGEMISKESAIKFSNLSLKYFGRAKQVIITKENTTIIADKKSLRVEQQCKFLRKQIELSDSLYEKEKLENRLAKLSGGVAVIKIGANTEVEMREKKLRFEDAINATKAAIGEGIVPGGGTSLARISFELLAWGKKYLNAEEQIGAIIIAKALTAPLQQIVNNSGKNGAFILDQLSLYDNNNIGYNAQQDKFTNLFEAGIIDPAKVTRSALQNAASIASMILTTDCIIPKQVK
uniref:60 kDa chaperone protein n=1 Tax=Bangiopsis subsimplex TaxID=139980 RepID=A0A1C9CCL6_9RHOD|nr:chaperonin GroEL [Bangiopsis subsimplex]AOM66138.1 chaperonin GroEL [Bangiopsis subsimplex]ARO90305.1 60 kDa chaperone protein [Bangiopsis subsimplex]